MSPKVSRRERSNSTPPAIGGTASKANPFVTSSVPVIHHELTGAKNYVQDHGYVDASRPIVDMLDNNGVQSVCIRCLKWSLSLPPSLSITGSCKTGTENVRRVDKWGIPMDMRNSKCAMCRLFALHAYDYGPNPMESRVFALHEIICQVKIPSPKASIDNASRTSFWYLDPTTTARANYSALMGVGACIGRTRLPTQTSELLAPLQIGTDTIDLDRLRGWLSFCKRDHGLYCDAASTDTLPALTLLDCVSIPPKLVPLQHHYKYAALSYVWGVPGVTGSYKVGDTIDESTIPKTIRDAMAVAVKLGLYLWVDRYCISQDPEVKQEQIAKMDTIYAGAEITIIAAAGQTIEYGLPGVTQRHRIQQPFVRIANDTFVSLYGDVGQTIKTSHWWQRAWCFQEALLSTRRLFFTDGQVYFQCRKTACVEVLNHPFERPYEMPQSITSSGSKSFYDFLQVMNSPGLDPATIDLITSTYSGKCMSYDSDALNAVAGILRAMLKLNLKTRFASYAGLSIFGRPSTTAFVSTLLWDAFFQRRRSDALLPSWSWIGWGESYRPSDITESVERIDKKIELCLVDRDGREIPWDRFTQSGQIYQSIFPLSKFINLNVLTDTVNVVWKATSRWQWGGGYAIPVQRFPSGGIRYAKVGMNHVNPSSGKLTPELHEEVLNRPLKCALLIPYDDVKKLYGSAILLRRVEDYYERIGLVGLNFIGDILDADGNVERFVMSTDGDTAIEEFNFRREWIRLG